MGPGGGGIGLPDVDLGGVTGAEGLAPGSAPDGGLGASSADGGGAGASVGGLGAAEGGMGAAAAGGGDGAAVSAGGFGAGAGSVSLRSTGAAVGRTAGGTGAVEAGGGLGAAALGAGGVGGAGAASATAGSATESGSATGLGGGGGLLPATVAGSTTLRGTAFFAGAFLDDTASEGGSAAAAWVSSPSSGPVSRIRPSRSALRRTRSACCSTTLEEWLLTPIPRELQRSTVSELLSPSSRASSYTRIFAKVLSSFRFVLLDLARRMFAAGTAGRQSC